MVAKTIVNSSTSRGVILDYFRLKWNCHLPLFKVINGNEPILYDTGTNKIFACELNAARFLETIMTDGLEKTLSTCLHDKNLLDGATIVKSEMEKEGILAGLLGDFSFSESYMDDFNKQGLNSLQQMTLEVTELCNMRCAYCCYEGDNDMSPRSHGSQKMSWETAKLAIDFHRRHSSAIDKIALCFYGGEPLLNFNLIKQAVSYAKSVFYDKELVHSITTNATLLTPEHAAFFRDNNFSVVLSLDGPKAIHNANRKFANGEGTFDQAIAGVKHIIEAFRGKFGDSYKEKILLSMVYAQPYYPDKYKDTVSLWNEYPFLNGVSTRITYPELNHNDDLYKYMSEPESKTLIDEIADSYRQESSTNGRYLSYVFEDPMRRLAQCKVTNEPFTKLYPNGCCIPGVRKAFVTTTGQIAACERIHHSGPFIGHVVSGFDDNIRRESYINKYIEESSKICPFCWANRLCSMCFTSCFKSGTYSQSRRAFACKSSQYNLAKSIKQFAESLKDDSSIFDGLSRLHNG